MIDREDDDDAPPAGRRMSEEAYVSLVLADRPDGFAGPAVPPDLKPTGRTLPPGLRRVASIPLPQLTANDPETAPPQFALVDPKSLLVNASYQRDLSNRSMKMIRRLVADWDWRKFKPPVVASGPAGLEVLDGQHTAIAAACHPKIDRILVMVVPAASQEARAAAFVGHNKERLNLTPMQVHSAAVTAGDAGAVAVDEVCRAAGVKILRVMPSTGFKARETVALGAIDALLKRRGRDRAQAVLDVLVAAECAPVQSNQIKAVDCLLNDAEYADQVTPEALTGTIVRMGPEADKEAAVFAAAHKVQVWRGLAVVLFRNTRKKRKGGD